MNLLENLMLLKESVNELVEKNAEVEERNNKLEEENVKVKNEKDELEKVNNKLEEENVQLMEENIQLMEENTEIYLENNELKNEKKMIENIIEEIEKILGSVMPSVQAEGVGYNTLEDAIASVQNGTTIKLNKNIEVRKTIVIDKEVILDLNGKRIYNQENIWNEDEKNWSLLSVRNNGKLTIKGNGEVEAKDNDCYAIDLCGGDCVIENGKFVGNVTVVYAHTGHLVINDGNFVLKELAENVEDDKYRYMLNCLDRNYRNGTASIVVNGGYFKDFNPENNLSEGINTNFVNNEFYVVEIEGNVYKVVKK